MYRLNHPWPTGVPIGPPSGWLRLLAAARPWPKPTRPAAATNAPASGSSTNATKLQETDRRRQIRRCVGARSCPTSAEPVTTITSEQIQSISRGDNAPFNEVSRPCGLRRAWRRIRRRTATCMCAANTPTCNTASTMCCCRKASRGSGWNSTRGLWTPSNSSLDRCRRKMAFGHSGRGGHPDEKRRAGNRAGRRRSTG